MASDGSGETVVSASPARQELVGWTPDGKYLLYAQHEDPAVRLWAVSVANGKIQGPAINIRAEFAPGSGFIGISRSGALYFRNRSTTYDVYTATMDPATGMVTGAPAALPVTRTGSDVLPRWAPDSRRLAYGWREVTPAAQGFEVSEVFVHSLDTGTDRLEPLRIPSAFCWTHDGAGLLVTSVENPT